MDVSADYCADQPGLSASKLQNYLTAIWANETNIFQPCPFLPGEYFLKDWNFEASHLPNIIPAGRYLMKSDISNEFNHLIFNVSMYFVVANYGILDLGIG